MANLCFLPQHLPVNQFSLGDCVHYVGTDPRIQQDYGNQNLRIVGIDITGKITVCENQAGIRLVGVSYRDLKPSYIQLHPVKVNCSAE